MLTFDNGLEDIGELKLEWTNTSPSTIYTQNDIVKYGKSAMAFNLNSSSTDYLCLTVTSSSLQQILQEDFTIDFWAYSVTQYKDNYTTMVEVNTSSDYNKEFIIINYNESNGRRLHVTQWEPSYYDMHAFYGPDSYNEWVHFALARTKNDNKFYLFRNGQLKNTLVIDTYYPDYDRINIGINQVSSQDTSRCLFHGYIDMFRISSICRWTTDFDCNNIKYYK